MRKAPAFAAVALVVLLSGCADPANWPKQPLLAFVDGNIRSGDIGYDLNRDGRVDYIQHIEGGLKTRFRIDSNGDGVFDIEFDRGGAPGDRHRTLVVLLDGIDFETMDALWAEGRFRLFHRPAPLISSFPSVTDTGWADVFNARRPAGIEASYFDRSAGKLGGGARYYLSGEQEAGWAWILSYRAPNILDGISYVLPDWLSKRELRKSVEAYYASDAQTIYIYPVASDAIAHQGTDDDIRAYLEMVDRAMERVYYDARGRVRIFMVAPHGQNRQLPDKRLPISRELKKAGFREAKELAKPADVVMPSFGLCNYVAIHTRSASKVAEAAVNFEGVELVVYRDARRGEVVVLSPAGRARVVARDGQYAYLPGSGDPLKLAEIIRKMRTARKLDADGFASPGDWFDATWDHYYPHAVVNVWRAFGELVDNSPDVILSLKPGYYFGKTGFSSIARIRSTHGSLRRRETTAFYMTTEYETDEPLYLTDFSADVAKRTGRQSPFDISPLPGDYGKRTQEKRPRN